MNTETAAAESLAPTEMPEQQRVAGWMWSANQFVAVKPNPEVGDLETRQLGARLIFEENLETISGMGLEVQLMDPTGERVVHAFDSGAKFRFMPNRVNPQPSLKETADGLADSLVVILGRAASFGINLKPVFDEVMDSNDTKFDWTLDELAKIPADWKVKFLPNGKTCVMDAGGKVRKPAAYRPPDIAKVLEKQMADVTI